MIILVGGMCSICLHIMVLVFTFVHLYSSFNLQLFLSILFLNIFTNLVLKRQTEKVNGTNIS